MQRELEPAVNVRIWGRGSSYVLFGAQAPASLLMLFWAAGFAVFLTRAVFYFSRQAIFSSTNRWVGYPL